MRFIDHIRRGGYGFNADTGKYDFDARALVAATTVFEIGDIADLVIESMQVNPDGTIGMTPTARGRDLIKFDSEDASWSNLLKDYVGIILPYDDCFFEYPIAKYFRTAEGSDRYGHLAAALHVRSLTQAEILGNFLGETPAFMMVATVLSQLDDRQGASVACREAVALITTDSEGNVLDMRTLARLPDEIDPTLSVVQPPVEPVIILFITLMMLNCSHLKDTVPPRVLKSRQVRKFEQQHPDRANPDLVSYHVLTIDLKGAVTKEEAWDKALQNARKYHSVRAALRHLASGKIVPVKAHHRGNPLVGIVKKDYKLKAAQQVKAAKGGK